MVKTASSSLTLPVLAVLVLLGAGVVFLGPQLTGLPVVGGVRAGGQITAVSYLYPVQVQDSDLATNPNFAVGSDDSNYAVLRPALINIYTGAGSGILRCPAGFSRITYRVPSSSTTGQNYYTCSFSGDNVIFGWLGTANRFKATTAGSPIPNPLNVISVQVSSSDFLTTPVPYGGYVQSDTKYKVFVRARCSGSSGAYTFKYLGQCSVSAGVSSRICPKSIGRSGCPSGKWQVNKVVLGNPERATTTNAGSINEAEAAIHWIRLTQAQ